MVKYPYRTQPPEFQADAFLSQNDPVSGTKYIVLDTTKNVRIISIHAVCTWTVQPTSLQIDITIDGILHTFKIAEPVSTTYYYGKLNPANEAIFQGLSPTVLAINRPFLLEARSVKVEASITGGTVQNLSARIKYAKY